MKKKAEDLRPVKGKRPQGEGHFVYRWTDKRKFNITVLAPRPVIRAETAANATVKLIGRSTVNIDAVNITRPLLGRKLVCLFVWCLTAHQHKRP